MHLYRWLLLVVVVGSIFTLDRWSKRWAETSLDPPSPFESLSFVDFKYYQNTGIAFGMFPRGGKIVIAFTTLAVFLLLACYRSIPDKDLLSLIALAFMMGGALGNLYDRIFLKYVIDFIYVRLWPFPFNVADSCISGGAILLIVSSLLGKKTSNAPDPV